MSLLIFAEAPSPRLTYTTDLLFRQLSGIPCRVTDRREEFDAYLGPRLNYSRDATSENALWVAPCGLLSETGIRAQSCDFFMAGETPALFPTPVSGAHFPFDLFAAAFYLVSRYEEYLPAARDAHERFSSGSSIAAQNGFLQRPVVNEWVILLAKALQALYPTLSYQPLPYQFQPTYDVDIAWAYGHRPLWHHLGTIGADLVKGQWQRLGNRIAVGRGQAEDPYFTFPWLEALHQRYELQPVFFFLLGDYSRLDPNIAAKNPPFRQLIAQMGAVHPIGIHPSYAASKDPGRMGIEVERLAEICGRPVVRSRQHFLRLRFPDTYRQLLNADIREDYTLGYADQPGFRAGIAAPFYWYDLEREESTPLLLHPFQVMDVTLQQYMGLSPSEAVAVCAKLSDAVRATGGVFSTLWHNSSFSALHGWDGWAAVYEEIMRNSLKNSLCGSTFVR
ncbi:MAG: polysaccharide deacetylase family protein [Saprospiraceae bacterium]|nr:polysaccharide deacetylase family protein [Saprospiraceae bacterium]MDZ4705525.1 polysaccharide deacetylase family protein [Saprospiraceae bacterium]